MEPSRLCTANINSFKMTAITKRPTGFGSESGRGAYTLNINNPYESWAQQEHTTHFGGWDRYSTSRLMRACSQFNECQMAVKLSKIAKINSMIDVGCATGRFYRFFRQVFPGVKYRGYDISQVAIDHAKQLYPEVDFSVFDGDPNTVNIPKPDLLFCRDVMHHQPNPKEFLASLYEATGKYLILRVRTREVGPTEFDSEKSCQLSYNIWVPYIVFNTNELTDLLSSYNQPPVKIDIVRHPEVLGGHLGRYLPKDLYFPETGTAETSLLIEKDSGSNSGETIITSKETQEPRGMELPSFIRFAKRLARR